MRLLLLTIAVLLLPTLSMAKSVKLSWDASPTETVTGYNVYYSVHPDVSDPNAVDVGDTLTYSVEGLDDAAVFYFAVTAYDVDSNESAFSNIVSTGMCISPPPNLGVGHVNCTNIIINVGK